MINTFGRGYVIDHCISTLKEKAERKLYDTYLIDAVRYIVNNTASQEKTILNIRYCDILNPPPEEERSGEEIVNDLRKKLESGR